MTHIDYFKLQAKNLFKDWKNREQKLFVYDIRELFRLYDVKPTEEPTLMKAQHLLAQVLGRDKWSDLLHEPEEKLAYTRAILEQENSFYDEYEENIEEGNDDDKGTGYHGMVECLHCGRKFPIDQPNHLPSCDGEIWDLIPVETTAGEEDGIQSQNSENSR